MDFIASNMKFLRKAKNWTQNDLAEELNIKRSLIGAYEEGRARPTYEVLQDLSKIFKYSIDQLITRDLRQTEKVSLFSEDQLKTDITGKNLRVLAISVDKQDRENIEMI